MKGRTVILVSHHVQLCAPGAKYIVALDNGRLQFQGNQADFMSSEVLKSLSQSGAADTSDEKEATAVHDIEEIADQATAGPPDVSGDKSDTNSTAAPTAVDIEVKPEQKKAPRKLVEEEKRAVGRIGRDIWATYVKACGGAVYWTTFSLSLLLAAIGPVLENGWLKYVRHGFHAMQPLNSHFQGLVWILPGELKCQVASLLHKRVRSGTSFVSLVAVPAQSRFVLLDHHDR